MDIQEYINYRKDLLEDSKDEDGFVSPGMVISQVLPLMVDAKLLDSEDWNDNRYANNIDNYVINGYTINESSERLQLFILNEPSIGINIEEKDLHVSKKNQYETLFKGATRFINNAIKGYLIEEVQDADPIRPLLSHLSSSIGADQFDVIEIFLISATVTVETRGSTKQPKRLDFEDESITISYSKNREKTKKELLIIKKLIDLNFLYDVIISQGNRESLIVDFEKLFNYKIEVIKAAEEGNFESYLCVLPATVLSELYKRYSSRLLEKNVRSFLQFKGVNKGIRDTIRLNPEKFIAFNNGITITAVAKEIDIIDERMYISSLTDFQIVNGGQTTASIYFTQKDGFPIDKVKVMAKINVAIDDNEENLNNLISDISKYSNSQTRVSNVDLSSRSQELSKLKALSDSVITPSGKKWFFEKARGEFNTKLRIAGKNKNRLEKEYPRDLRFTKEQLGKYFTAWGDQPYIVKKGGEKVFRYFLEEITSEKRGKKLVNLNRDFYEGLISKIILFRELEKIYGEGKNAIGQIRSAVIPYVISVIYTFSDGNNKGKQFDLIKIWKNEKLEDDLVVFFTELMELMNNLIKKYSKSDDYGEYSKKEELWNDISSSKEISEFMSSSVSLDILKRYLIDIKKDDSDEIDVDFGIIKMNIDIFSKGLDFYNEILEKCDNLSEIQKEKMNIINSSIMSKTDLSNSIIAFEENLMGELRKNYSDIFDQINYTQNYLLDSTLKFVILEYNKALDQNKGVHNHFKGIELKASASKKIYASVFDAIGAKLERGVPPNVKEIFLASHYLNQEINDTDKSVQASDSIPEINSDTIRKMIEWDAKMKVLTHGERSYLADFAYGIKVLNPFHKKNAQRHLETLLKAGFKIK